MDAAPLETVARNVRSARTAAGLSLDALAARAEVSKGALVALEGARGNPNLATLVRLADALGRSVSSLMEDAREDPVVVADAGAVAPLWTGPSGGTARLLLTNPRPAPVEVWRWRLHPGERHDEPRAPARRDRDRDRRARCDAARARRRRAHRCGPASRSPSRPACRTPTRAPGAGPATSS